MTDIGITQIQSKPSVLKTNDILRIIDKRKNEVEGFYIPKLYQDDIQSILDTIEEKKLANKLDKIANVVDNDFLEIGIDDGIE